MNLRSTGLFLARPLLSFGAAVVVLGPLSIVLSNPAVPGPDVAKVGLLFLSGTAAPAAGWWYGARIESAAWESAGNRLGLTPEAGTGGLLRQPDLTGTVDGRPVRVSQHTRQQTTHGNNTTNQLYTHIEVTIDPPAQKGVVVWKNTDTAMFGSDGQDEILDMVDTETASVVDDDQFVAVGHSDLCTQAVVSGAPRQALLDAETMGSVWVGDPSGAFGGVQSELSGVPMGDSLADAYQSAMSHDPSKATNKGTKSLLYGDDLEREVTAIVTVADAFEAARSRADDYA